MTAVEGMQNDGISFGDDFHMSAERTPQLCILLSASRISNVNILCQPLQSTEKRGTLGPLTLRRNEDFFMAKCKYCQAELPEGTTVCPQCGKDGRDEKKMTPGRIALVVAAVVVLQRAAAKRAASV